MFVPLSRLFSSLLALGLAGLALGPAALPVHAQRQMEALGRGVVAVRPNNSEVYVGWRLLGDDPSAIGFNVYRSIAGGSAVKLNSTVITASTNYRDTPPSSAFSNPTTYHVVPVLGGIEQSPSAPATLVASGFQQFLSLPLSTPTPNPDSIHPYDVKFCWVGDFDGDGEYDFLVDRVSTNPDATERQYLEAYTRHGTFLWRMDMGPNSVYQYAYEPGSSAISIGDTDNVTVYDLDGDGRAEVAVRTANGVTVTNAAGQVVTTISAASNSAQFVSIIDGLSGTELARAPLPNPWSQHGTLTNKCAIAYLDGVRPSVLFYGYNRADSGAFFRVFTTFDYRDGQLSQRWTLPQTFAGAEGHQIRIADVDNDGKDEIIEIGHVIDDDGTQLFVIPEVSHGDRFHLADIDPDHPGLENYIIQQYNPSFLATAYYEAGTGEMIKKWYATNSVDVGRGLAVDMTAAHKGYEMLSTQPGIFNSQGEQIYANSFFPYEGLWWDADLLREFIAAADGNGRNPIINKFNPNTGGNDRLWSIYSDFGSFINRTSYGGRPAFWGDILGDWREELVFVTSDYASLRIYTPTSTATNRLYTLMHNPAYRMQTTTKGYVQASYVDYYLGAGMTPPPPPPMVRSDLVWSGGPSASTWDNSLTAAWKNTSTSTAAPFAPGQSVRFDLTGNHTTTVALSGSLQPAAVTVYSPADYTFSGSGILSGSMPLTKAGAGTLTLSGNHSYTGTTTVWDGALRVDGTLSGTPVTIWGGTWGGALAKGLTGGRLAGSGTISQPVTLGYRGAITPGAGMGSAGTLSLGAGLNAADGAVLAFDLSADPTGTNQANDRLAITGNLALSGTVSVHINAVAGSLAPGTYTLLTYTGTLIGSAANLSVIAPEGTAYSTSLGSGALTFTVPVTRTPANVTWTGAESGVWDIADSVNWSVSGSATPFVSGDTVTFDAAGAARPTLTLNTSASVTGVTFSGTTNYTLGGTGAIAGSGGLTLNGPGTVTLNTTNTYTGPTSLNGGVLAVGALADGGQPSPIGASSADAANLIFNGGTLRLSGSQTNTNRAITLGTAGGTFDTPSATLQISGGLTGPGALTKTGAGTLILASANTHSGGTVLRAGTLVLASDPANTSGPGSGGITLEGGTLRMFNNTSSYNTSAWPIHVPLEASARFEVDGRSDLTGPLTGSGALTLYTPFVRTNLLGNWSAFSGLLNVVSDSDGGDLRLANSAGLPNAWLHLGDRIYAYSRSGSGTTTFNIGALSGAISSVLNAGGGSGDSANQPAHWRVGGLGLDSTFAGRFTGTSILTKIGQGTLTLTGDSTHSGATTITDGNLLLLGGSLSGSNVTVQANAGLGGNTTVTGNVTFQSGSRLLINPAASALTVAGNLTFGGPVTVAPWPDAAPAAGTYSLLNYTGTLGGTPDLQWVAGNGFAATFHTSTPGQITYTLVKTALPPADVVALPGDTVAHLGWTAPADAVSFDVRRATSAAGPYSTVANNLSGTTHDDTGLSNGQTYHYILVARYADNSTGESAPVSVSVGPSTPHAHWRLDETSGATVRSDQTPWSGSLVNSPARVAGRINRAASFSSASSQYATVPNGIVAGLNDVSFSVWVKLTSIANWARIFDFGTATNNYVFLSPRSSTNGTLRFAIRTPSVAEQVIDGNVALPTGTWAHVAVTVSGNTGTLYLNGVAIGTNSNLTLTPASLGNTTLNYLGRSLFSSDPYLNGAIDELQIFARALSPAEVVTLAAPPTAPESLTATAGAGQITLNWSAVADADAYSIWRSVGPATDYTLHATNISGTSYDDTGLTPDTNHRYVVTSVRGLGESAWSPSADASPTSPQTPQENWRIQYFDTDTPVGPAADDADPDADGLANLLEYALGGHPLVADPALLPAASVSADHLALSFTRIADPSLTYTVQGTDSLDAAWQEIWSSTGEHNISGPITVTDPATLSTHTRRFLRLQITAP